MIRTVGVFVFPDFLLLDASGPITAFELAARSDEAAGYELRVLSVGGGLITSSSGVRVATEAAAAVTGLDTLIIAGGRGVAGAAADPAALAYVADQAGRCRRIASVCSGAFLLAACGLLDGRRATTHWDSAALFARLHPKVRLDPDRIYTRDGPVWTSAGVTAGIDLALAMVAEDLGEATARQTAHQMVVYNRRLGGQSQFSALLQLEGAGERFAPLLDWARRNLSARLTVEVLAERAAMSPRHFARAFTGRTGVTPAKAIERLRLEAARARVEDTAEPIDRIAETAGFANPERMRRAFVRAFGRPPQALRRAARAA